MYLPQTVPAFFLPKLALRLSRGSLFLTPTNLRFRYLYRDASNNKQHGDVIFANPEHLSLLEIENRIRLNLRDGEFFIARQVRVQECFFDALDEQDDHPWHEFFRVEATTDSVFDPEPGAPRSIAEFLAELEQANSAGWDETNVRPDLAHLMEEQRKILLREWALDRIGKSDILIIRITEIQERHHEQHLSSTSWTARCYHFSQATA